MIRQSLITLALIGAASFAAHAATISHRYSFNSDGNLTDSVGGNNGVLVNGATVVAASGGLVLPGIGTGPGASHMGFSSTIGIAASYGVTGATVESWYTDSGSGTWSKLFTFGSAVAGQEWALTNRRGNGETSGIDRFGSHQIGFDIPQGVEHHVAISVAADGTMSAWLDGSQLFDNLATNPLSNITTEVESIGSTAWGDPGHLGSVNEFRIWSGTMTAAQVAQSRALGPNQLIPEPAVVILIGLVGLLGFRRRRA